MFEKIVIVEKVNVLEETLETLQLYGKETVIYRDLPANEQQVIERIGDADAVLVSYTTPIGREVIEQCPNIKYIGMCCSLYSRESANVDIQAAEEHGIVVTGVRDYGDEGVVEFVISELIQLFQGTRGRLWRDTPEELTGLKVGIIGLGATGKMIAKGVQFFGCDVKYFSRTRKSEMESEGIEYMELHELLHTCDVICSCLNKNVILLKETEFGIMGTKKVLINTGLSPSFELEPFEEWINKDNFYICDTPSTLGNGALEKHSNVRCLGRSSGITKQAFLRLSKKVIDNIEINLQRM